MKFVLIWFAILAIGVIWIAYRIKQDDIDDG